MSKPELKRTLQDRQVEEVDLQLKIKDLTAKVDGAKSMADSTRHNAKRLRLKARLRFVQVDITCLKREVEKLDKLYPKERIAK